MAKVEFHYKNDKIQILCNPNDIMEDICQKFSHKINLDLNNLIFLYSGSTINLKFPFSQVINKIDKERNMMSIIVNQISLKVTNINQGFIKSKFPICPKCSEKVILQIDNFKINLLGCKNGHMVNNMILNEYENTQKIDTSKIKCSNSKCNVAKSETNNNEMYICNICKMYLCPLCRRRHDDSHKIIKDDEKNYICEIHNELYVSYCKSCKSNICLKCEKKHLKHDKISYGAILPEKEELIKKLDEYRNIVATFNNDINQIIYKLLNVRENIEILYNIYYDMVSQYEDQYRNYEIFESLENIENNKIINEIEKINLMENINSKIENILNIYMKE